MRGWGEGRGDFGGKVGLKGGWGGVLDGFPGEEDGCFQSGGGRHKELLAMKAMSGLVCG